jgi:hypothetical protein
MTKSDDLVPELVQAARALEEAVEQLEAHSRSVRKIRLSTGKNIARAATELSETLSLPERMGERLQAVATALGRMQERQQAALAPLSELAVEVQRRTQLLGTHMKSFEALGSAAGEVNTILSASGGDRAGLAQAEARLQEISDGARALFEAARADDFPEIAREADVLKQRMSALRKRLGPPS